MNPAGVRVGWTWIDPAAAADVRLGPVDSSRLLGLTPPQRAALRNGRALLGALLAEVLGADAGPVDATICERCGAPHGRVQAGSVPVSVAYAGSLVVAAVGLPDACGAVGVDVELRDADSERAADLARLLEVAPEYAIRRWTQLEAVLKADGRGLRVDPGQVRLEQDSAWIGDESTRYRLAEVAGPADAVISVAWTPVAG